MKSIIKEIFIILLLCIAVCLIFGVIFYDYIPTNKVVPSTVEAYKTSNTIKDEISQEIVDYPKQNITIKRQDKSYESGKANPFSTAVETVTGNTTTGNTTISGNNNTNKNPDSTDHYFNNISGK